MNIQTCINTFLCYSLPLLSKSLFSRCFNHPIKKGPENDDLFINGLSDLGKVDGKRLKNIGLLSVLVWLCCFLSNKIKFNQCYVYFPLIIVRTSSKSKQLLIDQLFNVCYEYSQACYKYPYVYREHPSACLILILKPMHTFRGDIQTVQYFCFTGSVNSGLESPPPSWPL
jgi:hypothetical protein